MALPPERISIKRRRQEEPIETLILEQGDTANPKRRFTNFFFQRLRDNKTLQFNQKSPKIVSRVDEDSTKFDAFGIPIVKATVPGDEVKAYANYRSATKQHGTTSTLDSKLQNNDIHTVEDAGSGNDIRLRKVRSARHFHLARDISTALKPSLSGGIRRRRLNLRPPIATFVERHPDSPLVRSADQGKLPRDSFIELGKGGIGDNPDSTVIAKATADSKTAINTFSKPAASPSNRTGNSIQDDPSTWDLESDQLADELAALAFEFDTEASRQSDKGQVDSQEKPNVLPQTRIADLEDDYIFETYVRVRHDGSMDDAFANPNDEFGVLVIDDEDQDLWEKYVRDDDEEDDDWDEEDEDSNAEDNPHNDYPDEEVSSDDDEQDYDDERTVRKAYH